MKQIILLISLLISFKLSAQFQTPGGGVIMYDNCEQLPQVSWEIDFTVGYSMVTGGSQDVNNPDPDCNITLSGNYARKGSKSYRMYVKKDLTYPSGTLQWLRSEVMWMAGSQQTLANVWNWGSISLLVPPEWQFESSKTLVAYDTKSVPDNYQTPFGLMIVGNKWVVGHFIGRGIENRDTVVGTVEKGVWVDWVVHRNWEENNSGFLRVYKNGVLVYSYNGPNYRRASGDAPVARIQHGIYKWLWETPYIAGSPESAFNSDKILYMDEIRFGNSSADLSDFLIDQINTPPPPPPTATTDRVLVLYEANDYVHTSIDEGVAMIQSLGNSNNFTVTATGNSISHFNADSLAKFKAVVFMSTTGDILSAGEQTAFEDYIQSGGGFVGIHAALDCEYSWTWYGGLIGAWFSDHPAIQQASTYIVNNTHHSTRNISSPWVRTDEWYNVGTWNSTVNHLVIVDEDTYTGGTEGDPHPVSWFHTYDGGRAWITSMGHTEASFTETNFKNHVLGGIKYAIGEDEVNIAPSVSAGADLIITLPQDSVTLNGIATDDQSTLYYTWSKVSGTGGTIVSPTSSTTKIRSLSAGNYTFRLTVTDNEGLTGTDTVRITVNSAPTYPTGFFNVIQNGIVQNPTNVWNGSATVANLVGVNTNRTITGNEGVQMKVGDVPAMFTQAYLTLDNDPETNTIYHVEQDHQDDLIWIAIRNDSIYVGDYIDSVRTWIITDSTVDIGNLVRIIRYNDSLFKAQKSVDTGDTWTDVYLYEWKSTDRLWVKVTFDTDAILYEPAFSSNTNSAPTANAGTDQSISVNSSTLNGSGTDSDGVIVSYYWTKISGPVGANINYPTNDTTAVTGLINGTYVFRLTVTDNFGDTDTDDITITVNSAPPIKSFKNDSQINIYNQVSKALIQSTTLDPTYINQIQTPVGPKRIEVINTYRDSATNRKIIVIKSSFDN